MSFREVAEMSQAKAGLILICILSLAGDHKLYKKNQLFN